MREALILGALILSVSAAPAAADGSNLGGSIEQDYLFLAPLPDLSGLNFGGSTTLQADFEAGRGQASCKVSLSLAVLGGQAAKTFWAESAARASAEAEGFIYPVYNSGLAAPDALVFLSIPEMSLQLSADTLRLEAGRYIIKWGTGRAFSPVDFFSRFDYGNILPTRLPETAFLASVFPSVSSSLEAAAAPFDPRGGLYGLRYYTLVVGTLAAGADASYQRVANSGLDVFSAGAELSCDLSSVSPYAEFAASYAQGSALADLEMKFMSGFSTSFGVVDLDAEYMFDRQTSPHHSLYAAASFALSDWVNLIFPVLYYPDISAYTAGASLSLPDFLGAKTSFTVSVSGDKTAGTFVSAIASAHFDF